MNEKKEFHSFSLTELYERSFCNEGDHDEELEVTREMVRRIYESIIFNTPIE